MRTQPEQQAPPVQRLRIRYAKRGRLRFTSHRDFSRAFERAVFRARLPMAYSSGFNPHPRISYAGAAPTGSASEAEYLEIGLAEITDPAEIAITLDKALPPGLDVLEVVISPGGSLSERLDSSHWTLRIDASLDTSRAAVEAFLAAEEISIERMTKKGLRTFDCRAAVIALQVEEHDGATVLDLVLRHSVPAVRPDDVLRGLSAVADLQSGPAPLFTRLAQGPLLEDGTVGDPFA